MAVTADLDAEIANATRYDVYMALAGQRPQGIVVGPAQRVWVAPAGTEDFVQIGGVSVSADLLEPRGAILDEPGSGWPELRGVAVPPGYREPWWRGWASYAPPTISEALAWQLSAMYTSFGPVPVECAGEGCPWCNGERDAGEYAPVSDEESLCSDGHRVSWSHDGANELMDDIDAAIGGAA